ncbi:hypothetical protein PVAND_010541 [Polypedilum vanderplanki]|uniref:BZIP domain-containing protein n=1 Tax=Polypedilum vanderplanki TaxID=319348 RepID=A0A9J6CH20_POLVA|nr:hypothetical protein PVAND_010541 [Polypedilum vanderplanki]
MNNKSNNNSIEHPAVMDFREMDVLRFFFEINQQKLDSVNLQQILLERQTKQSMPASNFAFSPIFKPKQSNVSTPQLPERVTNISQIPAPKVVFQYIPSPRFPTPEPESCEDEVATANTSNDYHIAKKKMKNFHIEDRCNFIKLKNEEQRKSLMTPTSSDHESDTDRDVIDSCMPELKISTKATNWAGISIYNNLPDIVMSEYDRILRESHEMKVETIRELNKEFPVSYDYNPKKSRIRTNYSDPVVADDRTKNNIASRRSRQRKKFLNHVLKYSVDYDEDENNLLKKQEKWLRGIISSLENKIIAKNPTDDQKLFKLRKQCGFE